MAVVWVWTILWFTGLIYMAMNWKELPVPITIIASVALIFTTPSIEDLFVSYRKYVEEWERDNELENLG